ncbi:MAG: hypothetical protein R3A79_04795 [Nannocystaceae bacterium]
MPVPPPTAGLLVPALDPPWTPPMLVAGDLEALGAALGEVESWELVVDPRLASSGKTQALRGAIEGIAGGPAIASPEVAALDTVFAGPLPLARSGLGPSGRPRYSAAGLELDGDWRGQLRGPTVVVGDAALDPGAWSSLQAYAVGSCEPAMRALSEGQERSLALLGPFLDRLDALLWASFRAGLRREIAAMRGELQRFTELRPRSSFADVLSFNTYLCGQAYWRYVDAYARCEASEAACAEGPRALLAGGVKIGLDEPDVALKEECAQLVGVDYPARIREIAAAATRDAIRGVSLEWSLLAERLGLFADAYAALEDICVPRRRRLSDGALAAARGRLCDLGELLGSEDHVPRSAGWVIEGGRLRIAGFGEVYQLARFDDPGLGTDIRAQAQGLREQVLGSSRCAHASGELPLAIAAVGAGGDVRFFGYFFEEELLCGELAPLRGQGGPADELGAIPLVPGADAVREATGADAVAGAP